MPLGKRILRATLEMPSGNVVLDESLDLRIKIHKDCFGIQSNCHIEVFNLTQNLRQFLLSQFTAFNQRQIVSGNAEANWVNVTVAAGYENGSQRTLAPIFTGQIVWCDPISGPPTIGVRLSCYTHQVDKTKYTTGAAPVPTTFAQFVQWAGAQMEVDSIYCNTYYDDQQVTNMGASSHTVSELLLAIQNAQPLKIGAYIDNNILYVKNANAIVSNSQPVLLDEFIGTPMWTSFGVKFQTLFNPNVTLSCAATLKSSMNPSLNVTWVVQSLDYDLNSRETPFYVEAECTPPA